jgi:hypothetical protein
MDEKFKKVLMTLFYSNIYIENNIWNIENNKFYYLIDAKYMCFGANMCLVEQKRFFMNQIISHLRYIFFTYAHMY